MTSSRSRYPRFERGHELRVVSRPRQAARIAAAALEGRSPRRAAVHRRAPVERTVVQGHPPGSRHARERAREKRWRARALAGATPERIDAHRLRPALVARAASTAALCQLPDEPGKLERVAKCPVPRDRSGVRAARAL